jgi:hypothetical protein
MDPNVCLASMIATAKRLVAGDEWLGARDDVYEMAEQLLALHEWLKKGGFLPESWRPKPPAPGVDTLMAMAKAAIK